MGLRYLKVIFFQWSLSCLRLKFVPYSFYTYAQTFDIHKALVHVRRYRLIRHHCFCKSNVKIEKKTGTTKTFEKNIKVVIFLQTISLAGSDLWFHKKQDPSSHPNAPHGKHVVRQCSLGSDSPHYNLLLVEATVDGCCSDGNGVSVNRLGSLDCSTYSWSPIR